MKTIVIRLLKFSQKQYWCCLCCYRLNKVSENVPLGTIGLCSYQTAPEWLRSTPEYSGVLTQHGKITPVCSGAENKLLQTIGASGSKTWTKFTCCHSWLSYVAVKCVRQHITPCTENFGCIHKQHLGYGQYRLRSAVGKHSDLTSDGQGSILAQMYSLK